ncbi:plasmid mobilization protein [Pseudomonas veronii]
MAYDDPSHKRSAVIKARFTPEDLRYLRMEAKQAGMQLATYIHELSMIARRRCRPTDPRDECLCTG